MNSRDKDELGCYFLNEINSSLVGKHNYHNFVIAMRLFLVNSVDDQVHCR